MRKMNWERKQKRESEEIQYFHPDKRDYLFFGSSFAVTNTPL